MNNKAHFPIDLNRRAFSSGIGASLLGAASISHANTMAETLPFAKPAPFTAQEFWQRILDLANEKNGQPTRERVERAIGTQFVRVAGDPPAQVFFIDYGKDWYFNARLFLGGNRPGLQTWAKDRNGFAFLDGSLLWSPYVYKSLIDSGWMHSPPPPHFQEFNRSYRTEHAALSITVVDNVLTGFSLTWLL